MTTPRKGTKFTHEAPHVGLFDVLKEYWQSVKNHKFLFFAVSFSSAMASLTGSIIVPIYYKYFFDIVAENINQPAAAVPQLFTIILMILGWYGAMWLGWRIAVFSSTMFQTTVGADLTERAYTILAGHSYSFFSNNFTGALTQRIKRYSQSFARIADRFFWDVISIVVKIVGTIVVLWFTQKTLAVAILIWIVVIAVFAWVAAKWKLKHAMAAAEADSVVMGNLSDILVNHTTVQLFNSFGSEFARLSASIREHARLIVKKWNVDHVIDGTQAALNVIIEFVIFWILITQWGKGGVTVGMFVLVQMYVLKLSDDFWNSTRIIRDMYESYGDAKEMVEIIKAPHDIVDAPNAEPLKIQKGEISLNDVHFYFNKDREVLKGINLTVKPGERVALIGASGAGKSTLVRLLLRLYDIISGSISIDGQDIRHVTQGSLREAISFVPQDPVLFHRSLKENILYGNESATDEEVIRAAKLAHCHEFISSFPKGYDTFVGERGVKLSGGERQRVAIARAILKNAPILILDEATSSLDSHSETLIQDAMETLMKGKTVIVIAHRLSTIRKMDRIVVVNHGLVTEEGTHDSLIAHNGLYAKLWSLQSGGFIQDISEDEAEKVK